MEIQTEIEHHGRFTSNNDFIITEYTEEDNGEADIKCYDTNLSQYTYNSAKDKLYCKPTFHINTDGLLFIKWAKVS
ncbi:10312_t:CDS:2 [Entrophospora sp. SA101]|nr:10312_t:CDS:2 [Entrophospora sp. SA101]